VRLLHAAAENRREEAGELHGVPVLLGGGLGGGVEAEGEGEGVVPAVEAGARMPPTGPGGGRGGEGEEVLEEVVLGAPGRRRLAGHGRRRGRGAGGPRVRGRSFRRLATGEDKGSAVGRLAFL